MIFYSYEYELVLYEYSTRFGRAETYYSSDI